MLFCAEQSLSPREEQQASYAVENMRSTMHEVTQARRKLRKEELQNLYSGF